eukprot:6494068-Alexandrium_andersonii.AAC.1
MLIVPLATHLSRSRYPGLTNGIQLSTNNEPTMPSCTAGRRASILAETAHGATVTVGPHSPECSRCACCTAFQESQVPAAT